MERNYRPQPDIDPELSEGDAERSYNNVYDIHSGRAVETNTTPDLVVTDAVIGLRKALDAGLHRGHAKRAKEKSATTEPKLTMMPDDPNSLGSFLREAVKTPLLTADQEVELAKRVEKGDLDAKEHFIKANTRLVMSVARKYQGLGLSYNDLLADGITGLIRAAELFDWRKGFKFSTYATLWIKQSIQRGLHNTARTIRMPTHIEGRLKKVDDAEKYLQSKMGRSPSSEEIAERAGMTLEDYHELMTLTGPSRMLGSLDFKLEDGEGGGDQILSDFREDPRAPEGAKEVIRNENNQMISDALDELSYRQHQVITMYYGLDGQPPISRQQIAKNLGITITVAKSELAKAQAALRGMPDLEALAEEL